MKHLFVLLISLVLLYSCEEEKSNQNNEYSEGEQIISYFDNGNPRLVKTFIIKDGESVAVYEKEYYENSAVLKEGPIKNGKRDGLWKSFRGNGLLWSEGHYIEGVRDGITITYHPNGNKYYEGYFSKGLKSGKWKFYNDEGMLLKEEDFDKK